MASNKDEISLDEFDFPNDFWDDTGEGSFESGGKKSGKRTAVTEFTGSFFSGVKKSLLNGSNQRRIIDRSLPSGFVAAYDATATGVNSLKLLQHTASTEINKVLKEAAPDLSEMNKSYGKFLPKRIRDKLNHKLEEAQGSTYYTPSEEESYDSDLDKIMRESLDFQRTTFKLNEENQARVTSKVVAASATTAAAVNVSNKLLGRISLNSDKAIGIGMAESSIARKNAQTTFKHYIVSRQLLDTTQQMLEMQREAFSTIVKNTGLPEAVKITNWEQTSTALKSKLVGMATERATRNFGTIFGNVSDKLGSSMKDGIGTMGMMLSMYLMQASGDATDMMGDPLSRNQIMGGKVGEKGMDFLLSKLGTKLGGKYKTDPRMLARSNQITNFMNSGTHNVTTFMKNNPSLSLIAQLMGMDELIADDPSKRRKVRGSALGKLDEVTAWNRRDSLAINEVIPGWLGKIHHELNIMRTGDVDADPLAYDYEKSQFTTASSVISSAKKKVYNAGQIRQSRKDVNAILKMIDPNNVVKGADRKVLQRYIIDTADSETSMIDPQALMSVGYSPINEIDPRAAARIAEALQSNSPFSAGHMFDYDPSKVSHLAKGNLGGGAEYQSAMKGANDQLKSLRGNLPNYKRTAINFSDAGQTDLLAQAGIIVWNNSLKQWDIDHTKFQDRILGMGEKPTGPRSTNSGPRSPNGFPRGGFNRPLNPTGVAFATGQQSAPTQDPGTYTMFQNELLETIERMSSKPSTDVTNQLLEAIRERLDMGIPTGAPSMDTPNDQNRKTRWYRKLLEGSMAAGKAGVGGYYKFTKAVANSAYLGFIKTPMKILKGITELPGMVMKRSGGAPEIVRNSARKFGSLMGDIYVGGKEAAVMKLKDIMSGEYFDQTSGKVIKSFKDIKGAVVDRTGNVVLTADEYARGIFTIVDGKRKSIIGGAMRAVGSLVSGTIKMNAFLPMKAMALAGKVKDYAVGKLMGYAVNVYVAGENTPRLLGSIMGAGGYFNKDGSVITKITDIKGDVLDASGEVILTTRDMAKGLMDRHGKPLKVGIEKIIDMGRKAIALGTGMVKGSLNMVKSTAMAPFKLLSGTSKRAGNLFNKLRGKAVSTETLVGAKTADRLDDIYNLLDERIPRSKGSWFDTDGSGFRDGSRDDVLAKRAGQVKNVVEAVKPKEEGSKKGILGLLMTLVGGVGGVIGTLKGWASSIFGLMRWSAMTKMATSGMDMVTSLLGRKGGGGKAAAAGAMAKFIKGPGLKIAAAAGLYAFTKSSYGQKVMGGAWDSLTGADQSAYNDAINAANGMGGGSSSGGGNKETTGPDGEKLSLWDRVKNGMGGSALGELGAIATFPALAAMYNKMSGSKFGKFFPKAPPMASKTPTSKLGKLANWGMNTNAGRITAATALGGGIVAGQHALFGSGGESLESEAGSSYRNTLLLDAAMAGGLPLAYSKYQNWKDGKAAAALASRAGGISPAINSAARFTPVTGGISPVAATIGNSINPAMLARSGSTAAKAGMMAKGMGLGKSILKHGGLTGAAFGLADAMTTEGTMVDKGLAFGKTFLTTAAIDKGLSIGGQLLSAGGRQALMASAGSLASGASAAGSAIGGAATAVGGFLASPVVLGALAVGAAVGGGYLAYKYFYGKDKSALARYRFAQYGVDLDDKDQAPIVGQLESMAAKYVSISGDKAFFKTNMPAQDIVKLFGLSEKDKDKLENFITWFSTRFKPVFLNAFAAYSKRTGKTDLEKADDLSKEDRLALLDAFAAVDPSAYTCMASPFKSTSSWFSSASKLKYDADDVKSMYKRMHRKVNHEKGDAKSKANGGNEKDGVGEKIVSAQDNWKQDWYSKAPKADSMKYWGSKDAIKNNTSTGGDWFTGAKTFGGMVGNILGAAGHVLDVGIAKMTGSQKQWQMGVYNACKTAGFSEQQARILTAEIGRENSYNPKNLFGGHADPHRGQNLGMLSWQGDRRPRLINFLAQAGVLSKSGEIIPSQQALDAQAKFMMWELKNTHSKVGKQFLANPNISYAEGTKLIGMHYILWRYTDPKYAQGHKNRDQYYNMLLKQLGATDGDTTTSSTSQGSTSDTSSNTDYSKASNSSSTGGGGSGTGWFDYMSGGGSRQAVAEGLTKFGGNTISAAGAGFESAIPATLTAGGVPTSHRAYKAAQYATQKASAKSTGYCAKYVANALLAAGYKFTRQVSAYMYAQGALASAGFAKINARSKPQCGDVMVYGAHGTGASGGATHGHIQIFNGSIWVSDFKQQSQLPGQLYAKVYPTLWRDSTLMSSTVQNQVKANKPSSAPAVASKTDVPATVAKPPATVAKPKATNPLGSIKIPSMQTSSFMAGGIDIGNPAEMEDTTASFAPVSSFVEKQTQSAATNVAQVATAARERTVAMAKDNELVSIAKAQLDVMISSDNKLARLCELTEQLVANGGAKPVESKSPQDANSIAAHMRGQNKTMPVSMSALRKS